MSGQLRIINGATIRRLAPPEKLIECARLAMPNYCSEQPGQMLARVPSPALQASSKTRRAVMMSCAATPSDL